MVYTFDGERGAPRSELCHEAPSVGQHGEQGKQKDCVVVSVSSLAFHAFVSEGFIEFKQSSLGSITSLLPQPLGARPSIYLRTRN